MKTNLFLVLLLTLVLGCNKDSTPTSLPQEVQVRVTYTSGFNGDSVIVSLDNKILLSGLAYSEGLNVPVGCVLSAYEGIHKLTLELPLQNSKNDTNFIATANYITRIESHFDRVKKKVTYEIFQDAIR